MADDRGHQEATPLTADDVAGHEFPTTFRGYEPSDVRAFLERVAARLRAVEEQSQAMRVRIERLQARAAAAEKAASVPAPAPAPPPLDEAALLSALGEQAAHILRTAHEGADAITKRAEEVARDTVAAAEAEANRAKLQAEAILSSRVRDADAEAVTIVRQARDDGERLRVAATAEAGRIVDEGRVRGREIIDEAQGVRERVLGDLMKRRRVAQVQIEQLRAGRERLLEAYRVVRRTLDEVTDELQRADAEARAAAEAAGRRLAGEPGRSLPTLGRSGSAPSESAAATPPPGPSSTSLSASSSSSPAGSSSPSGARAPGSRPSAARTSDRAIREPIRPAGSSPAPESAAGDDDDQPAVRVMGHARPAPRRSALPETPPRLPTESVRIIRESPAEPEPELDAADDAADGAVSEGEADAAEPVTAFPGMDDSEAELARLEQALDEHRAAAGAGGSAAVTDLGLGDDAAVAVPVDEIAVDEIADDDELTIRPPGGWPPGPRFAPLLEDDADAVAEAASEPDGAEAGGAEAGGAAPTEPVGEVGPTEPVPEPEGGAEPEGGPAAELASDTEPAAEPAAASEPDTTAPEAPPVNPTKARRADIDQLFARIRAEREEATAKAHEVLDRPSSEPGTEAANGAAPAAASVSNEHEAALQRRDRVIEPVLDQMTRKLKRALQDEQNDLLDRLRNLRGRPSTETLLLAPQTQADRFRVAAGPFLADAATSGVSFYGGTSDPVPVQDLAENLAFSIVGPLRRRLELALDDGQADDAGTVAEQIGAAYREWKTQRIEQVAGDHVVAAFSRGVLAGAETRSSWIWVVDDQGTPCPDCDDNSLAGSVPSGESFPTGQLHPPAHTGCRCLLVPGP